MSWTSVALPLAASPVAMSAVAARSVTSCTVRADAAAGGDRQIPVGEPSRCGVLRLAHQLIDGVGDRPVAAVHELVLEQVAALQQLIRGGDHEALVVRQLAHESTSQAELGGG